MRVAEIDRFEGEYAVCELESGEMINILKGKFWYPICEGDIINVEVIYDNNIIKNVIVYGKNEEEKKRRIQVLKERLNGINRN